MTKMAARSLNTSNGKGTSKCVWLARVRCESGSVRNCQFYKIVIGSKRDWLGIGSARGRMATIQNSPGI